MDDASGLKFGVAEDVVVAGADEQSCQGQDVAVSTGVDACRQFLGLRFEFGVQRFVQRHGILLGLGEFAVVLRFSHVMDKSSTNSSAAHTQALLHGDFT